MSEELKPCPFCGGRAHASYIEIIDSWIVHCETEHNELGYFYNEQEAITAWNTRAESTCRYECTDHCTWVCSSCGREVETRHYGYNYCPHCGAKVVS